MSNVGDLKPDPSIIGTIAKPSFVQLPDPEMPSAATIARAKEHAMPPLDRNGFKPDAAFDATLERLHAADAQARCAVCGSTDKISFQQIDGSDGNIKAENCDACHSYVKVLYQQTHPALNPVADDVASLGLDLLVREAGYRRGAVNPFLLGY